MKILFVGGTGIISRSCAERAATLGHELFLLHRGTRAPAPQAAITLVANIADEKAVRKALAGHSFDAVVDWIAFTPADIERDLALFRGIARQYVFVSSASAYHTPPRNLPVTESTPLFNPFWQYSRNKIACEERLLAAYRAEHFPVTIVRPSHTYDATYQPIHGGYTVISRMMLGKPVIVHGDGTSLWTLTHARDFAVGLVGLLGQSRALGEAFHITSDEVIPWNYAYESLASALGVEPKLVHIPSEMIARHDPEWGCSLLGDKAHSMIFDNTKIRRFVPEFSPKITFAEGAREIVAYHRAMPSAQKLDPTFDRFCDEMCAKMSAI